MIFIYGARMLKTLLYSITLFIVETYENGNCLVIEFVCTLVSILKIKEVKILIFLTFNMRTHGGRLGSVPPVSIRTPF